jgi:hypothetical protein
VENYLIVTLSTPEKAIQLCLNTPRGWTEKNHVELSRAEKPEDKYWTVEIIG